MKRLRLFFAKVAVDVATGCWSWTGAKSKKGYGSFGVGDRRTAVAHRWSWEFHNGPVPPGQVLDHRCRNRGCVNPAHLEVVSVWENTKRGISPVALNASKTHCKRGHPLSGENLRIQDNSRRCATCARELLRARRLRARRAA